MHVTAASPAGCHVNTQLPNKVQKDTGIARNTGNNKLTTSKHTTKSQSQRQRVSVRYTFPSPQPLTAGPQTIHQQIAQGLGYAPMLALTEPPLGFETLTEPGFGVRPNPGENLGTIVFAKSLRYIYWPCYWVSQGFWRWNIILAVSMFHVCRIFNHRPRVSFYSKVVLRRFLLILN